MLGNIQLENVLFLDIETVPAANEYHHLPPAMQQLWDKKAQFLKKETETSEMIYKKAGIYAEFGKIICISVGIIKKEMQRNIFRIKSFYGDEEKVLLSDFIALINTYFNKKESQLCAHNGKEFDFPYIARRVLINGLKLPSLLDISGKKPWEVCHLDTMELWKFGDYKSYTSLDLLANIFNIPTPKEGIDGSMINDLYWREKNMEKIVQYCQKDVLTVAQLILKFRGENLIKEEDVMVA